MAVEIIGIKRLTDERFLNLYTATFSRNGDKESAWVFVSRNKEPGTPQTNAIIGIATVNTPEGKRLVCTREFRIPIGRLEYGFFAGLVDDGEDIAETTKRELKEETGLDLVKITKISPPIVSSAGMSDECVQLVFLEAQGTLSDSYLEDGEEIDVMLLDYEQVCQLCNRTGPFENVMIAAKAWPVLYMFEQLGRL